MCWQYPTAIFMHWNSRICLTTKLGIVPCPVYACMPGGSAKQKENLLLDHKVRWCSAYTWHKTVLSATFSPFMLYISLFLHCTHLSAAWANIRSIFINSVSFQHFLLHLQIWPSQRQVGATLRHCHSSGSSRNSPLPKSAALALPGSLTGPSCLSSFLPAAFLWLES